jgi:hypothetical protein
MVGCASPIFPIKRAALEEGLPNGQEVPEAVKQVKVALRTYSLLVVLITLASWTLYKFSGHPFYFRPLFDRANRFHDLTDYVGKMAHLRHAAEALGQGYPIYTYPAPAAFVYKFLIYAFPASPPRTFLCVLAVSIATLAFVAWRASRPGVAVRLSATAAILTTAAFGYPLWYDADLGNIEGVVWALSAFGLCFLLRGRYKIAAVLIGLAGAVKPFPILFLLLLVSRRKYKEAALGVATAGLVTLAALTYLGPNPIKAYQQLKPGVSLYMGYYILRELPYEEGRFVHSLLDGIKSAALIVEMHGLHPRGAAAEIPRLRAEPGGWPVAIELVRIYPMIAAAGFGLLLIKFRRMPALNQMTALGVAVTLFPLCASDYTLLHLLVPFGALVVFWAREVVTGKATMRYRLMLAFAVIYGLLFAPLTFLMLYAGDAKFLLLLALLFVAARTPMPSAYFDGPAGQEIAGVREMASGEAAGLLT